ncbi:hypothetical protein RhiirA4_481640 [Rhizophagus irregularis]|uniref:Uncharacterized protein n=1 Tax=Rhizophagus irregularis TaxID=588596 RepID=A0A2I1HJS5_9GLOM|nr:hypothetical protein RhiirA4_481640 [Rhizophagus irregularis]
MQSHPQAYYTSRKFTEMLDQEETQGYEYVAPLPIWQPSTHLSKLHTQFQTTILSQYICLPCAFCGKLLYSTKAKWFPYDENYTYPLEINFQNINIYIKDDGSIRAVCVCESCKNNQK